MIDPTWLPEYSGQTTDELIDLAEHFRSDSIVVAFHQALDQKVYRLGGYSSLSLEERAVLAVQAFESDVNIGGYGQYFQNVAGPLLDEIVDALSLLGRSDLAELTKHAIGERHNEAALKAFDARYFELAGDLAERTLEFIKRNRARIALV